MSAIKEIGEIAKTKPKTTITNQNSKILSILINTKQKRYEGIDIEDFDSTKQEFYLFSDRASKGNAPYPFCPLNFKYYERTFNKVLVWLTNSEKYIYKDNADDALKSLVYNATHILKSQRNEILKDLSGKINEIPRKTTLYLTAKIDGHFLGEYDFFKSFPQLVKTEKRKRSSNISTCSICGNHNKEVSGKSDVFKFYTIDKPGFIAGGFKELTAWKNFPVCNDCYLALQNGRKYLEDNLRFSFYGFNYLLIPKLLITDKSKLSELLDILSTTKKEISLKHRTIRKITSDEEDILDLFSNQNDLLTVNFLFLQNIQSAERIVLAIDDVFPSRIKKIFEAKEEIDSLFQNYQENGFTFATIRNFFSRSDENKKSTDLDKYFLEIVHAIFKGEEINFPFLAKFIMPVLRKELLKEDNHLFFRVRDALMLMSFLEKIGIIKFREVSIMEINAFDSIFNRYGNSFASPIKRGVFLIGVLTQLLLNKQSSERNTKPPFIKKLKGLKMDERDIKGLLPQIINKMEEYDALDTGKQRIAKEASKYLLEAGENWKLSIDEINYYFACGMCLANEIANIVYNNPIIKEA
ncbi:MAG: TIGR02556 family CRISPR-associated protein [Candidatus Aminicenantes bacterium]|nr:TIGR02556 family CRISPR-associated protein [Candidatus Aminicenantes bacterium]